MWIIPGRPHSIQLQVGGAVLCSEHRLLIENNRKKKNTATRNVPNCGAKIGLYYRAVRKPYVNPMKKSVREITNTLNTIILNQFND